MLNVLGCKYDAEGKYSYDAGPEAEVARPYIRIVFNLQSSLGGGSKYERDNSPLGEYLVRGKYHRRGRNWAKSREHTSFA